MCLIYLKLNFSHHPKFPPSLMWYDVLWLAYVKMLAKLAKSSKIRQILSEPFSGTAMKNYSISVITIGCDWVFIFFFNSGVIRRHLFWMLLRMTVSWHPGIMLVVFRNLLCKGGRDWCFRWWQVCFLPSWHNGNRALLSCHLFVVDRKPAVISEEWGTVPFMLKYLGISNAQTMLIRS